MINLPTNCSAIKAAVEKVNSKVTRVVIKILKPKELYKIKNILGVLDCSDTIEIYTKCDRAVLLPEDVFAKTRPKVIKLHSVDVNLNNVLCGQKQLREFSYKNSQSRQQLTYPVFNEMKRISQITLSGKLANISDNVFTNLTNVVIDISGLKLLKLPAFPSNAKKLFVTVPSEFVDKPVTGGGYSYSLLCSRFCIFDSDKNFVKVDGVVYGHINQLLKYIKYQN